VALPAVALRIVGAELRPEVAVLVFGAGVVTSAFLLAWAAEAAQVDISGSLAIALLALVAVLPEYAVDLYFSFTAGHRPEFAQYAAANMTGSNRLLMGVGWPLVARSPWSPSLAADGSATMLYPDLQPVAVALEADDLGVVHETVDHGGGHDGVAEDFAPATELLVRGHDDAGPLVAGRHDPPPMSGA
jgi:hypothetical protein